MTNTRVVQKESIGAKELILTVGVLLALIVDGMDMQLLSLALPTLSKEFHLNTVMAGMLGTWTLVGMGVGGFLASWLADRFGRVKVVLSGLGVFAVFTALLGFVHDYTQFAVIRTLSGLGLSAVWMCGTMVVAEYIPTSRRTTVLGILQAGWSVGYVVAALVSSWMLPVYGWRPMFIWSVVPGIIAFLLLSRAQDPPSWYAARKARLENKHRTNEYAQIFGDPKIRKNLLLWAVAASLLQVAYYGANNWLPSYLAQDLGINTKNAGWYVSATYFMMIVGKAATGWLADLIGRKKTWLLSGVLTAAALPIIMSFATKANVLYFLLLFGLLYGAPYAVVATYISESFPTSVRGTAYGTAYNLGRIVAIFAPVFIGYVASAYSIGTGIALLGIAYLICGIVPALFIPEKQFDPKSTELTSQASSENTSGKSISA